MPQRKIEDQGAQLMQGTDYGDPAVQNAMALQLPQRLEERSAVGRCVSAAAAIRAYAPSGSAPLSAGELAGKHGC
jgi:hypothetical protein